MTDLALKPSEKVTKTFTSEDTLRKENPFYPNYIEWLWKHGEQILMQQSHGTSSAVDFYEVPKGFIFYLCSAQVTTKNSTAASNSGCYLGINKGSGVYIPLIEARSIQNVENGFVTINYSIPIMVLPGENMALVNNTSTASTTIQGFIVPISLIPQF